MALIIFFTLLIVLLGLGFPIYIGLFSASFAYILANPDVSVMIGFQKMINAPNSFTLLAVPFFIFAGQIMNKGGVTSRIFKYAKNTVGHHRGGLGYVNVFSSIIFAGMSGSALADAGGLGMVEIKAMREDGYDDDFAIGVTAASSIIGPIIPPSIPFVIYGAVANVSIGGLFIGGIIPGLIMAMSLCVLVWVYARKRDYPIIPKATFKELVASFRESSLAILTPVLIIGGIWSGLFTPTEAALVTILYAMIVTKFVYKELSLREVPAMAVEMVKMVAPAIMIVASANLFGWIMNYEKIDELLMSAMFGLTTNKFVLLIIINLILLILGMFLEVISAIMLLLPLIGPIVTMLGVHPIHFGVIMVLNLMIGLLTPPVGFVLYILSSTTGVTIKKMIKIIIPWICPLLVALVLITFIPELTMWLPKVMGFVQ